MTEELINFDLPKGQNSIIKVIGVGGGGGNAVNHMFSDGIQDVDFVVCNTDSQALENSPVGIKIQLGKSLTEGRGAGNKPEIGKEAAIENLEEVLDVLGGHTKMVFITAGMGGGTGTGGAPVIAKAAKELGLLTVAIVTIPFRFEGERRINQAIEGISEIENYVDSLLIINNEKLREVYGDMKFSEAFANADNILATAAKGIAEIITIHGYINVDFADVETVLTDSGVALMGTGMADGEDRAVKAIQMALNSPLLNDNDITGTENILLNIRSGSNEISMDEIGEIADYVHNEVGSNPNIIWGTGLDESLGDKISITIIATGFESSSVPELYAKKTTKKTITLSEEGTKDRPKVIEFTEREEEDSSIDLSQRSIDFDLSDDRDSEDFIVIEKKKHSDEIFANEEEKRNEIKEKLQKSKERLKDKKLSASVMNDEIDELESEPAYKRKNIQIDEPKISEDDVSVSKYSLEDDEEKNTHLNENNSYLYDNVD